MDWEALGKKAAKVLPVLGNALVPGVGGIAGTLISEALGTENEPGAIANALDMATPDQMAKLKEMELAHRAELVRIAAERDRMHLADRQDARDMQKAALQSDDKVAKRFVYIFGAFVVTVSFVYIFLITFMDIPKENVRFADTILGFMLGTLVATVIQFFFGSSEGSSKKTQLMAAKDSILQKAKERLFK